MNGAATGKASPSSYSAQLCKRFPDAGMTVRARGGGFVVSFADHTGLYAGGTI